MLPHLVMHTGSKRINEIYNDLYSDTQNQNKYYNQTQKEVTKNAIN